VSFLCEKRPSFLLLNIAEWVLYNVQQSGTVPQMSNSRLSPLLHEPTFVGFAVTNDAIVDIPLGVAKVSEFFL